MRNILPKDISVSEVQKLLQGGIGPRPIALVSTISKEGVNNLSPFSFFNVFGANPPVVAFSASRKGRDASLKDTYKNIIETKECVIQAVGYSMVEQINLASTEYEYGVDEFVKSGLTPVDSDIVKPKRVKESPFQMECRLLEMKSFGDGGGAANIAICEVLKFHVDENIFDNEIIQPDKIDLVGRLSGNYYVRSSGSAIFEVQKPVGRKGIGYDQLPEFIRLSNIYTANNLGRFGNTESIPSEQEVMMFIEQYKNINIEENKIFIDQFNDYEAENNFELMIKVALNNKELSNEDVIKLLERTAKCAIQNNQFEFAWKTALYAGHLSGHKISEL